MDLSGIRRSGGNLPRKEKEKVEKEEEEKSKISTFLDEIGEALDPTRESAPTTESDTGKE